MFQDRIIEEGCYYHGRTGNSRKVRTIQLVTLNSKRSVFPVRPYISSTTIIIITRSFGLAIEGKGQVLDIALLHVDTCSVALYNLGSGS